MTTDTDAEHPAMPGGLVPLEQWQLPETSVHRTVRSALRDILAQLRAGVTPEDTTFRSLDALPALSARTLAEVAPAPDPATTADAVGRQLARLTRGGGRPRRVPVLVAPPFSGVREALACLDRRLLTPPDEVSMTPAAAACWWDRQALTDGDWVLPELADFWLRHPSGLALVREFLSRVALDQAGDGLVGCSSWCWTFWTHYLPELHVAPVTPAPLTGERLTRWLAFLAGGASGRTVTARMSHDGLYVLPAPDDGQERKYSGFARDLAALSRGNPGVALALWRQRLRSHPEDEAAARPLRDESGGGRLYWVAPLEPMKLPAVPTAAGPGAGHILHALLLHDGLPLDRLAQVTGLAEPEARVALSLLLRAELVAPAGAGEDYRVQPLGYPAVRKYLHARGYPVDGF
ncbi:hypothetical protein [uncultured Marinobacter sp.]|uniref:hypothetical protein n=1 Tax=uncultured Marinobacter sp. TaxID=187379 RepID=UPI000C09EB3F|nr:hypothetical protein [Marinobacter sp.]MBI43489.1 hypothetical protein [Oceanospirillales bacterium]